MADALTSEAQQVANGARAATGAAAAFAPGVANKEFEEILNEAQNLIASIQDSDVREELSRQIGGLRQQVGVSIPSYDLGRLRDAVNKMRDVARAAAAEDFVENSFTRMDSIVTAEAREQVRVRSATITEQNIQAFVGSFIDDDGILSQGQRKDISATVSEVMKNEIMALNRFSAEQKGGATLTQRDGEQQLKAMKDDPKFEKYHSLLNYIAKEKVAGDPAISELIHRIHNGEDVDVPWAYSKTGETSLGLIINTAQYRDAIGGKLNPSLREALGNEITTSEGHISVIQRGHDVMQGKGTPLEKIKQVNEAMAKGSTLEQLRGSFTPEEIRDAAAYTYTSYTDTMSGIVKFERMSARAEQVQLKVAAAKERGEAPDLKGWEQKLLKNMEIVKNLDRSPEERVAAYKEMNKNDPRLQAMMATMDPEKVDAIIENAIKTIDAKGGMAAFKNATAEQKATLVSELGVTNALLMASQSFGKGLDAINKGDTTEAVKQADAAGRDTSQVLQAVGVSPETAQIAKEIVSTTLANTAVQSINAQNAAKSVANATGELAKGNFMSAVSAIDLDAIRATLTQSGVTVKETEVAPSGQAGSQQAVAVNTKPSAPAVGIGAS